MIDSNESGHDDAHIMSSVDYIRENLLGWQEAGRLMSSFLVN